MKLIRRLKNLWELSQTRPLEVGEKPKVGDVVVATVIPKQDKAIFISRKPKDPLEEILKHE